MCHRSHSSWDGDDAAPSPGSVQNGVPRKFRQVLPRVESGEFAVCAISRSSRQPKSVNIMVSPERSSFF